MKKIKFVLAGNPYRTPHFICITAQGENGEVGKLFASIGPWGKIRVDRLGVDPAFRRQGIAKAMFEKMLDEAKTYFTDKKLAYLLCVSGTERRNVRSNKPARVRGFLQCVRIHRNR